VIVFFLISSTTLKAPIESLSMRLNLSQKPFIFWKK